MSNLHPHLYKVGPKWLWVIQDCFGITLDHGAANRREKARKQMARSQKRQRKR